MDFRQLQLFIAVAEELHFGRAAARVGMAQPPFSQQISRLEREIGAVLLTRTSRRVRLTSAGERLLSGGRELIARRSELVADVVRAASGEAGSVRLGVGASASFALLSRAIARFRAEAPGVVLHLDDTVQAGVGSALISGDLDLALVRGPFRYPGLTVESALMEPLAAVLPVDHPLAGQDRVELAALAAERFVLFPRASAPELHDAIVGMCVAGGFSPEITYEVEAWSSVISLVEAGLGVSIAPVSAADLTPAGVLCRPIADAGAKAELCLAYPARPMSPAAERLASVIRRTLAPAEGPR